MAERHAGVGNGAAPVKFAPPLTKARLTRRYKRFLADVDLGDGATVTVHCPNTGSMLGCAEPGAAVWLSHSADPKRKYPLTWELVQAAGGALVGVNTGRANRLVEEAIAAGVITELAGYAELRREQRIPGTSMRADFRLQDGPEGTCWVEVKNVTAAVQDGVALFPDAVTTRGQRHMDELSSLAVRGVRAVLCFCVQRQDVHAVRPADEIDPAYGAALRRAVDAGVEVLAYGAQVAPDEVALLRRLPVRLP